MPVIATIGLTALVVMLAYWGTRWLETLLARKGIMDVPNQRSSHKKVTPKGGGLAIIGAAFAGLLVYAWLANVHLALPGRWHGTALYVGVLVMATVGWLDDTRQLSAPLRLLLQSLVALAVLAETAFPLQTLPLPAPFDLYIGTYAGFALALFWMVALMNIFNFLDGIDGFAGTQAMLAAAAYATMLLAQPYAGILPMLPLFVAAAALGFLGRNWHPATIFMGDTGSLALGFLFAALPFYATAVPNTGSAIFAMAMLLWFFIADGALTIITRARQKQPLFKAHRQHLFQQLTDTGMKHNQVVLRVMAPGFGITVIYVLLYLAAPSYVYTVLLLAVALFIVYYRYVQKAKARSNAA